MQDFDGYSAVQTGIAGAINLTHPARANSGEDFIGAQASVGLERHLASISNGLSITL
jgi:hypothetical protein